MEGVKATSADGHGLRGMTAVPPPSGESYVSALKLEDVAGAPLSTGLSELDALTGGLPWGAVVEVAGPSGVGKSQWALSVLARALEHGPCLAVWGGSTFPVVRMAAMLRTPSLLDRLHVATAPHAPAQAYELVVLDQAGDRRALGALLASFLASAPRVLLVNTVRAIIEGPPRRQTVRARGAALRREWRPTADFHCRHECDYRLLFQRASDKRYVWVDSWPFRLPSHAVAFKVTDSGIESDHA